LLFPDIALLSRPQSWESPKYIIFDDIYLDNDDVNPHIK